MTLMLTKISNSSNKYLIIFFKYVQDFVFKYSLNALFIAEIIVSKRLNLLIFETTEASNVFKFARILFIVRLLTFFIEAIAFEDTLLSKWCTMRFRCEFEKLRVIELNVWFDRNFLMIASVFQSICMSLKEFWDVIVMKKAKVSVDENMSFTFEDFEKFDDCDNLFENMSISTWFDFTWETSIETTNFLLIILVINLL
jgi:hypothetical protein